MQVDLEEIEQKVCDITSEFLCIPRRQVFPHSRLIDDLNCDSLVLAELIMTLEESFNVTIPNSPSQPVGKLIFSRKGFSLSDLSEYIFLAQSTQKLDLPEKNKQKLSKNETGLPLFSQLGGRLQKGLILEGGKLFEPLENEKNQREFRRASDGMRCVFIPSSQASIGSDKADDQPDEHPCHPVHLDSFLIDAELVSTTAFCRFLNSVPASESNWLDWFLLGQEDDRAAQMPITQINGSWKPIPENETLPMILVSWFGANAYSLWANGESWDQYANLDGFLPSEAQWEYVARGAYRETPMHDMTGANFVYGQHEPRTKYRADNLPMVPVHHPFGVSDFGLNHMAGNVWQWCRDWYANDFYHRPESRLANPVNTIVSGVRSERGGSWVGPKELCRTTYRRGRAPNARGRCLGFRCISPVKFTS